MGKCDTFHTYIYGNEQTTVKQKIDGIGSVRFVAPPSSGFDAAARIEAICSSMIYICLVKTKIRSVPLHV